MRNSDQENQLRKFLLGQLSEDERAAVEDRFVSDDGFFEQLLAVEDELIDAYIGDELSAVERRTFEAHFQSGPQNLERLEFAKTLRESVVGKGALESRVESRSGWHSFIENLRVHRPLAWAAAIVLAVALGTIWIFINRSRIDEGNQQVLNQPGPQRSPQIVPQKENVNIAGKVAVTSTPSPVPSASLPKNSLETSRPVTATFILVPGLTRDAGSKRDLRIPTDATQIHLRLQLDQGTSVDFKQYSVSLLMAEGTRVWSGAAKPAGDRILGVNLPARHFQRGDYVLELKGTTANRETESVAEYFFRIP